VKNLELASLVPIEHVSKIKIIKGRHWNSTKRYWAVPYTEETIKYLMDVFGEEVVINSSSLTNSDFKSWKGKTCKSKAVHSDFLDLQENGLDDLLNISSAKNCAEEGKYIKLVETSKYVQSKSTEEIQGLLPAVSERTKEVLLLVTKGT